MITMRHTLALGLAGSLAAGAMFWPGCGAFRDTRRLAMNIPADEGTWHLADIGRVRLEKPGWTVRVVDSRVLEATEVPRLEKLVIEIVNTSAAEPLIVESDAVLIEGIAERHIRLGPQRTVVLRQNESHRVAYEPGLRAELLPYPFGVRVQAYRDMDHEDVRKATLRLY